ncbi:MAG: RnfABCDGE type electron transport complex subunit D [Oscillospiraceae bacterium]|jgi:electron transport complex protein RnfD|nr:RnfABCDGE type electron transport complex subunit D [Oscillospiraceae bacterium]
MPDTRLVVSSSPHIRAEEDTHSIMLDVCIALAFPLVIAVYFFGLRALTVTAVSVAACVFFEWAYRKLLKKPSSVRDLSAVVTGLLLSFNLPVSVPYWLPVVGAFVAVVVVKQLYGGIGKIFLNPALAARVFLFSFPVWMTSFPKPQPGQWNALPLWGAVDAVSAATPLSFLKHGALPADTYNLQDLVLGQIPGSLGEVSALMLLLGGVYLVVRRVITPRIPVAYLGTVAALTFLFPKGNVALDWMLYEVLSGGLVLGAVFMATDYATSPVTKRGQWIFGVGCGLLTVFIRYFGAYPEGVSYAILVMNACVWLIDKISLPRRFGIPRLARFIRKGGGKA